MTGRERLLAVLNRQPTDRLCWTALVDDTTRSAMPSTIRELPMIEFYRHLGCDLFCFGNFALPPETRFLSPCHRVTPEVEVESRMDGDGVRHQLTTTPWGTLTASFRHGHPAKHPVETLNDLRVLREIWQRTRFVETEGTQESHARLLAALGDDGIFAQTLPPSPVQQLIEYDMGLQNFYYLLQDDPVAVEELLDLMHRRRRREYEIIADKSPVEVVIPVENTSTNLTSPAIYRRYSLPQLRELVDVMHAGGKTVIVHMCGLLKALLPDLKQTGLDGAHAVTPPPVGDTEWDHALDILGDGIILIGSIGANVLRQPNMSPARIHHALDELVSPRVRSSPFILNAGADGTPVPVESFYAVRDWVAGLS